MWVFDDGFSGLGADKVGDFGLWEFVYFCCNRSFGDIGSFRLSNLCFSYDLFIYSLEFFELCS